MTLAERLADIENDAGNKWVWKNHESLSHWVTGKLLPWIRDADAELLEGAHLMIEGEIALQSCPHANCPFKEGQP